MSPLSSSVPLVLITLGVLIGSAGAILAGESVDWDRHGFLVKILARHGPNSTVNSCTGTLISASLVLTSGHCVYDRGEKKRFAEFVVFVPKSLVGRNGTEPEMRSTAKVLATNGQEKDARAGWALLRIVPQNITELCPPAPAPRWVSRLNFRPSLLEKSRIEVDPAELASPGASCELLGFATTENPEKFLTARTVFRFFLEQVARPSIDDPQQHHRSRVLGNFTACYDDAGAPLLCKLPSLSDDYEFQLGLFQSLEGVKKDEKEGKGMERCRQAREMHFSLLANDKELAEAIQKHAMAEFVQMYVRCFGGQH